MNNSFINQFSENIKFNYTCFDRVIIPGYILNFFSLACVVLFFRAMGFSRKTNGIMRIFTDRLNSHISKQAAKHGAQICWWPSMDGGVKRMSGLWLPEILSAKKVGNISAFISAISRSSSITSISVMRFWAAPVI